MWISQRVLEAALEHARRPRATCGARSASRFVSMIGRTWLIGIAILAVGLAGEREDGFTAALVCLAAYTVHLATALILRPLERNPNQA